MKAYPRGPILPGKTAPSASPPKAAKTLVSDLSFTCWAMLPSHILVLGAFSELLSRLSLQKRRRLSDSKYVGKIRIRTRNRNGIQNHILALDFFDYVVFQWIGADIEARLKRKDTKKAERDFGWRSKECGEVEINWNWLSWAINEHFLPSLFFINVESRRLFNYDLISSPIYEIAEDQNQYISRILLPAFVVLVTAVKK